MPRGAMSTHEITVVYACYEIFPPAAFSINPAPIFSMRVGFQALRPRGTCFCVARIIY